MPIVQTKRVGLGTLLPLGAEEADQGQVGAGAGNRPQKHPTAFWASPQAEPALGWGHKLVAQRQVRQRGL